MRHTLLGALWLALFTPLVGAAETETNAAIWYHKAFHAYQMPSMAIQEEMKAILAQGWIGDHPAVVAHLQDSVEPLEVFKRGSDLSACVWSTAKDAAAVEGSYPKDSGVGWLLKALLIEGSWQEHQGIAGARLESALYVLRFTNHLEAGKPQTLLGLLMGMIHRKAAYKQLLSQLEQGDLSNAQLQTLIAEPYLWGVRDEHFAAMLTHERNEFSQLFAKTQQEKLKKELGGPLLASFVRPHYERYAARFDQGLDQYVHYAISAVRAHDPGAFARKAAELQAELRQLREALRPQALIARCAAAVAQIPRRAWSRQHPWFEPHLESLKVEMVTKLLVSLAFSGHPKVIWKYLAARTQLNLLGTASAICLYERQRGVLPSALSDLVPDILAEIPLDPFGKGAPLVYRRANGSWWVYSIGPDGVDQQGLAVLDEKTLEGSGDISLTFAINRSQGA